MYSILSVSLDCPFLIVPSVFCNVYLSCVLCTLCCQFLWIVQFWLLSNVYLFHLSYLQSPLLFLFHDLPSDLYAEYTKSATSGAGTAYPSGAPDSITSFRSFVFCAVSWRTLSIFIWPLQLLSSIYVLFAL